MPSAGWRVTGIHHVAFAHAGAGVPERLAEALGLECIATEAAPGFTERMLAAGDDRLQLLEATGDGVVQRFVERRGAALHHVAFSVDDLDAALDELRGRGTPLVDKRARAGGGGTRIAFLHPSACAGMLVELVDGATAKARR
jgi:methylmalonyl-CoA/ethylmalonyl-CoA epimerase